MTPEQIHNLREALAWARVNGWHRADVRAWERYMGSYSIRVHWWATDYRLAISRVRYMPMRLFFYDRVRDVDQAIDLLVSLGYLPARFHSAYAAGLKEGAYAGVAMGLERLVEVAWDTVSRAHVAEVLDGYADQLPLSDEPYERRRQLAAVTEVAWAAAYDIAQAAILDARVAEAVTL